MPGPRQIQIDNVDRLPPQAPDSPPWSHPQPRAPLDWASILALGGVGLLALLIGAWLFGSDLRRYLTYGSGQWIGDWAPRLIVLAAVAFLAKRWYLVRQPGGFEVSWLRLDGPETVRGILSVHQAHAVTPFKQVAAYTLTEAAAGPSISTTIEPQMIDAEIVPSGPVATPEAVWLPWIDEMPHLLIAGRTNAGKTTLARAILAERAAHNEQLLILDPHDQPGKWFDLRAIGGGRDFDAVLSALAGVLAEMAQRFKEFDNGKPTEDFERLTVLIDEVPALVASTMDGNKTVDPRWKSFAKQLGSEARKVRISAILLTQSPLVSDIQINSYMRENFTRVALGDQVATLLNEETDKPRRQLLADLLRGRAHAAAMEYKNEIHVLDTAGVPARAAQRPTARMWLPPAQRVAVSASAQTSATVRASVEVPGAIIYPATVKSPNGKIAWLLDQGYSYRQIERELSVSHSTIRDVRVALQAARGAR